MIYSDDLDWLASNLQNWKPGFDLCVVEIGKDGERYYRFPSICSSGITKREWLGRRAELQAKTGPHPFTGLDEAIRKVLSVMRTEPEAFTPKELSEMRDICVAELAKLDTIEKLTDMHESHEEIDTSAGRVQETEKFMSEDIEDVLELAFWEFDAARGKSGEERLCFKNKARWLLENYGGRGEPEHDDGWHERGVLPPAGIRCEAEFGGVWEIVYVVGRDSFDRLVIECADCDLIPVEATNFRPIRTEREEMIDNIIDMLNVGGPYHEIAERICDGILAAGFKREGGAS